MKQLRFESFPVYIQPRPVAEPTEHGHVCPECGDTFWCYAACPEDAPDKMCAECEGEQEAQQ